MNLAIFGSAFNPIHAGHLCVARNALKAVSLDRVLFTPSGQSPHKSSDEYAPDAHRVEMIRLAIAEEPRFEVFPYEIEKSGVSYSIETVEHVRKLYPGSSVYFLLGSDNFEILNSWYRISQLIDQCEFLVVKRPGRDLTVPPEGFPAEWLPRLKYQVVPGPTVEVSSSEIREGVRLGKNISHLLPGTVYEYLQNNQLYRRSV